MSKIPKTLFVIPGYRHTPAESYGWLKKELKGKAKVIYVPIQWKYRTMDDYVAEFTTIYQKYKSDRNYVIGFSFGAVIALLTAELLKPDHVFLCSLSPYFAEDREWLTSKWPRIATYMGRKRLDSLLKNSGRHIAQSLTIPTTVFYGEAEGAKFPQLITRAKDTVKYAHQASLVIVPTAPHSLSDANYREAIRAELKGKL